jgi:hypothetical protein
MLNRCFLLLLVNFQELFERFFKFEGRQLNFFSSPREEILPAILLVCLISVIAIFLKLEPRKQTGE